MSKSIRVGIHDWTQFSKVDGFYPSDLPAEWKLSYFSNEFDSACLKLDVMSSKPELLRQWCEDLRESFELSFVLNHLDQLPVLAEIRQSTAVSIRYLVVEATIRDKLLHNKSLQPILSAVGIEDHNQIISSSDLWIPDQQHSPDSSVALFPISDSMRQYRKWIENWMCTQTAEFSDRENTLWLPGSSTDYQLLGECRTLVELMGF